LLTDRRRFYESTPYLYVHRRDYIFLNEKFPDLRAFAQKKAWCWRAVVDCRDPIFEVGPKRFNIMHHITFLDCGDF
jgi:hypothetical protein